MYSDLSWIRPHRILREPTAFWYTPRIRSGQAPSNEGSDCSNDNLMCRRACLFQSWFDLPSSDPARSPALMAATSSGIAVWT